MKKVIIFIPSIEKGGVERNAIWVANALNNAGYEIELIYVRADEGQLKKIETNVKLNKLDSKRIRFVHPRISDAISIKKEFGKYLKGQDNRRAVILSFQSSIASIGICRKYGFKIICRLSNHPSAIKYEKSLLRKISEWLKPVFYKKADVVISNSKKLSEDFAKKIKKDVFTIYNPIDIDRIKSLKEEKIENDLLEEASKYRGRLFISVGRIVKQKDYFTMIRAVSLSKNKDKFKLWIVGEGSDREKIEKYIIECNLQNTVRLVGYRSNVYAYLNVADVFLQTSLYEGCPNALIEAVAVGLPAIVTNCLSGPAEVLLNGEGGTLVDIGDAQAMADKIDEYLSNPEPFIEKKEKASDNIYRFYGENTIKSYIDIIDKLLEKERG